MNTNLLCATLPAVSLNEIAFVEDVPQTFTHSLLIKATTGKSAYHANKAIRVCIDLSSPENFVYVVLNYNSPYSCIFEKKFMSLEEAVECFNNVTHESKNMDAIISPRGQELISLGKSLVPS